MGKPDGNLCGNYCMTRPQPEVIEVDAARLQYGKWNEQKQKDLDEGDIRSSYSGDVIAFENRIRKPFQWRGYLMVMVAGGSQNGVEYAEVYQLLPLSMCQTPTTTYRERTSTAEAAESARNDPMGFYNGMVVSHGKDKYVLCGPEMRFVAIREPGRPDSQPATPSQLNLFA